MKNRFFTATFLLGFCCLLSLSCKKDNVQPASTSKKVSSSSSTSTAQGSTESNTPPPSGCHKSH